METGNNTPEHDTDIRTVIQTAILNFKMVSREIRNARVLNCDLSNLSLYVLLSLKNSKPLLRNDFMKRFRVNYYDAGNSIEILILNGLIVSEVLTENTNIKSLNVQRKRYRLTLSGELFVNDFLSRLQSF